MTRTCGSHGTFCLGGDGRGIRTGNGVVRSAEEGDIGVRGHTTDTRRTIQQLFRTELRVVRNTVDGVDGVINFGLIRGLSIGVVYAGVGGVQRERTDLEVAMQVPTREKLGVAFAPDRADLCDAVDAAIAALRESGEFARLQAAWPGTGATK